MLYHRVMAYCIYMSTIAQLYYAVRAYGDKYYLQLALGIEYPKDALRTALNLNIAHYTCTYF